MFGPKIPFVWKRQKSTADQRYKKTKKQLCICWWFCFSLANALQNLCNEWMARNEWRAHFLYDDALSCLQSSSSYSFLCFMSRLTSPLPPLSALCYNSEGQLSYDFPPELVSWSIHRRVHQESTCSHMAQQAPFFSSLSQLTGIKLRWNITLVYKIFHSQDSFLCPFPKEASVIISLMESFPFWSTSNNQSDVCDRHHSPCQLLSTVMPSLNSTRDKRGERKNHNHDNLRDTWCQHPINPFHLGTAPTPTTQKSGHTPCPCMTEKIHFTSVYMNYSFAMPFKIWKRRSRSLISVVL